LAQKANLSFKNRLPYISLIDEASDFKFGIPLEFANAHHRIHLEEKVVRPWARGAPRNLGLPL